MDPHARIPCINPRCRRTASRTEFPDSVEIICGRCFRSLPASLRRRHKAYWTLVRKLRRLSRRKDMVERTGQLARIGEMNDRLGNKLWRAIAAYFVPIDKPKGLDAFLEEIGL